LNPVFSPDSRSVAFWSGVDQTVKRIAVTGGTAVTVCPADRPYGMSWGPSGIVVGQGTKGILRASPDGGPPEVLVSLKPGEAAHGPEVLPADQWVLFTLASGTGGGDRWDTAQIVVQSLKTGERKTLVQGGSDARYLPTGHIVYARGGVLFAIPFDLRQMAVRGESVPMVEGVRRSDGIQTGAAHFSVSRTGSLVYVPGPAGSSAQGDVALVDRKGVIEKLTIPTGSYESLRLSPDGKQLALGVADNRGANTWIYEMSGASSLRQLTFGGRNRLPVWTADGQRIVFQSDREGDLGIFWQRADGTDTARRLTKPEPGTSHAPESWSRPDELFSFSVSTGSGFSLRMFSVRDGKTASFSDVRSGFPIDSVFSPDGKWVAYIQYEGASSSPELRVEPFPATGAKYIISKGVLHPLWSPDGNALFYTAPAQLFMVSITTRPSFKFGPPVRLPRSFQAFGPTTPRSHDIMSDGRFVGVVPLGESVGAPAQIHVVLNWLEELKQRVPVGR